MRPLAPSRRVALVGPRAGNASGPASDVPSDDTILDRMSQVLGNALAPVVQELKAIKADIKAIKTGQGSMARLVGRLAEMLALQNLPPDLVGCQMVRIRNTGDLDDFLGGGTAVAVMEHVLGSPEKVVQVASVANADHLAAHQIRRQVLQCLETGSRR
ncbi:hypothetical protein TSOC_011756 [Tetrabaena socialis]|uniref:Uncharacterized protein n=1 Tax=Tetrabaena socialis TaxID=47790 RepID=A0A2J7ZPT8_9CHLO|nr:hypothetical protein TSOC_011756 [Tetrabaena socialis]|eukprot:PNH02280.1 hypothetical protein TSOC_011756 [Tetrabaena socialis]